MVLRWADQNLSLARGFGDGLAQIFKYLDRLQVQEILLWMLQNPSFAGHLGFGLGSNFPSLQEQLQKDILSTHLQEGSGFANGLGLGLASSIKYLNVDLQQIITNIAEKNQTFANAFSQGIKGQGNNATQLVYGSHNSPYDDFLLPANLNITYASGTAESWKMSEEVSFPGQRQNCCICFIDMMNSTKATAELTGSEITRYYGIFLNAMATIARNFGAKIIKNAGDCLIFYFPDTSSSTNRSALINTLECGITMMAAHAAINSRLYEEKLPSIDYRISYDYGEVQVAKSASSQSDDLFGSIVNVCAKINSKAKPNGMVIGNDLYSLVKSFEGYRFEKIGDYAAVPASYQYGIYSVEPTRRRNILNPFKRTSFMSRNPLKINY
jgi:class 3 adenylate cyclase